ATFEVANPEDGRDIVIQVSQGSGAKRYTLHCIPLDVPDMDISVSTSEVSDGLLFVTPQFSVLDERKTYLLIIDNNGVPRFQRKIDGRAIDFKLHPNGMYTYALRVGRNQFGIVDSVIVVLDDSFDEIDRLSTVGLTQTDNHDFIFTEEGSHIFVSYNSVVRDMTAFGLSAEEVVGDSVIQEVDNNGNIIFEWSSWDHIDLSDCQQTGYPRFPADYAHVNAVSLTEDGDLIGSFRGCAQVLRIDRSTGDVDWYLGGSQSDYLITGDPFNEFCGQHTAWQLENGNVLMFDNGSFCLGDREALYGQFSRAVEYSLDPETSQAMFVRDYSLDGAYQAFTRSQGSVQPLTNGNWLVGWGNGPDVAVTEVSPSGQTVFEMRLSVEGETSVSYRAFRSQLGEL
ncbi:MAG: aryl-sulfate sulfotransferase, partial [Pseudomonadota bacterium]